MYKCSVWTGPSPKATPRRPHSARSHLLRDSALRFVFFQLFARTCAFSRHNARLPVRARLQSVGGKRNHEFESNLLRQPVSPFLSLGGVLHEKSILPPKTREYRTDKHRMFVSTREQACYSAHISPREGRVVAFQRTSVLFSRH
jgi:hypothetical protein